MKAEIFFSQKFVIDLSHSSAYSKGLDSPWISTESRDDGGAHLTTTQDLSPPSSVGSHTMDQINRPRNIRNTFNKLTKKDHVLKNYKKVNLGP